MKIQNIVIIILLLLLFLLGLYSFSSINHVQEELTVQKDNNAQLIANKEQVSLRYNNLLSDYDALQSDNEEKQEIIVDLESQHKKTERSYSVAMGSLYSVMYSFEELYELPILPYMDYRTEEEKVLLKKLIIEISKSNIIGDAYLVSIGPADMTDSSNILVQCSTYLKKSEKSFRDEIELENSMPYTFYRGHIITVDISDGDFKAVMTE